jgi:hypothetical protein
MGSVLTASGRGRGLDPFRRELILTREELWVDYVGLGGVAGIDALTGYLAGATELGRLEHNTIAHALNERYVDLGRNHPVPYID